MPTCPNCGATVAEEATYCSNCKATTASPTSVSSIAGEPNASHIDELNARLEKALRRNELLSYAAAGLAIAIFAAIIALAFL